MSVEEDNRAKWRIYRMELIFLNPEEYRWQVFQYWPGSHDEPERPEQPKNSAKNGFRKGPREAVYRTQAKKLLQWVYEAAQEGFADPVEMPKVEIDTSSIWNKMLERIKDEGPLEELKKRLRKHVQLSCIRIREICEKEAIPRGHAQLIQQIIAKIRPSGEIFTLTPPEARDLVSALYVAHDWDVWGRLAFPGKPVGDAPPKHPINAARLSSFSYVIDYPDEEANNLLGYRVDLLCSAGTRLPPKDEAARSEADREAVKVSRTKFGPLAEYGDYFRHCHTVRETNEDSYRLYGFLIDEIAKRVAGPNETIFIRCFPLRICGYDHFLQVLLQPTEPVSIERDGVDLPPVFSNPGQGELPALLVLKECLREMIVQMHVAAFQRAIIEDLNKLQAARRSDLHKLSMLRDPAFAREMFARHAPNLVRMERVWVNKHAYTYHVNGDLRFEKWMQIERDDDKWKRWNEMKEDRPYQCQWLDCEIGTHIPWEEDFKSLSVLLGGTGTMRLEEQWNWMVGAIKRLRVAIDGQKRASTRTKEASLLDGY